MAPLFTHKIQASLRRTSTERRRRSDLGTEEHVNYELRTLQTSTTKLSERIFKELWKGQYECVICTDKVLLGSPSWSCTNCFYVFHFPCLYHWAGISRTGIWHCPTCKHANEGQPEALCWCGRMAHEDLLETTGGSCLAECRSEIDCGAATLPCTRICERICHPGPCSPPVCSTSCVKGKEDRIIAPDPVFNPNTPQRTWRTSLRQPERSRPHSPVAARNVGSANVVKAPPHFVSVLFVTLLQAVWQGLVLIWSRNHIEWLNRPLKHRKFTEKLQPVEFGLTIVLSFIFVAPLTFFIQLYFASAWASYLKRLFKLERADATTRCKKFMRELLHLFLGLLSLVLSLSFFALWFGGSGIGWYNQMRSSCDGFDTRVQLDESRYGSWAPSESVILYNPLIPGDEVENIAGINHFDLSVRTDYSTPATDPFYKYERMAGSLSLGEHLVVDFDLQHRTWRMSTIDTHKTKPSLPHKRKTEIFETVLRNGTWNEMSPASPHLNFPSLELQIPNMHYFTKNCVYQAFMTVFRTKDMDDDAVQKQSNKHWSPESADNVVMRTASFGHGYSHLELCAKRDNYLAKGKGGAGAEKRQGLGDDVLVPLGLMAVLRRHQDDSFFKSCYCGV